jgi:hypothetical protein
MTIVLKMKTPEYWSCFEEGLLTHTTMDAAIEDYLDLENPGPKILTVYGFADEGPGVEDLPKPLADILDYLDSMYDPDLYGFSTKPTKKMLEAQEAFLQIVSSEYTGIVYREVCQKKINTKKWIEKNRPDWVKS